MFSERIVVFGNVQGVGYRAYVAQAASTYGVKGRVWNLPISGVAILAQHDDCDALYDGFIRKVAAGPGTIWHFTCERDGGEVFEDFQIAYGPP
ncbi:MAG: acylphosphatase [Armatimonadetes bacterium]|nr:acylphosphatase [Armatimonadota bacterium]